MSRNGSGERVTVRLHSSLAAGSLLLWSVLISWPAFAQPQGSDVFSSSGEYDRFAVGGAHRWYDNHTDEFKQNSSHCLTILTEAKAYQEQAFALYAQAKQPGLDSAQITALRRQGMEQIKLRENKIRAFIDCVNRANRRQAPVSDTFSTKGDDTPSDQVHTQPSPKPSPTPENSKGKRTTQVPDKPPVLGRPQPQDLGDVFNSESSGSNQSSPAGKPERPQRAPFIDSIDDSDCLPKIDAQVIEGLKVERNELLRDLAGGGYMTDLTMKTLAKLLAAHLYHLTEPNEGLLSKTTRKLRHATERAPQAVVKAGQAVAAYMTNNTAANHRYLYGQVEMAVRKAEGEIRNKLRNPHITIAEIADSFLVGKATGTVCRWTDTTVAKLKIKTDQALDASEGLRRIARMAPPESKYCGGKTDLEDCFWKAMVNATGDPSYLNNTHAADLIADIQPELKKLFGGPNAKDPLTGKGWHQTLLAHGLPFPLDVDEFVEILRKSPDGFEALVFVDKPGQAGHLFSTAKLKGESFHWDNQQKTTNLDIMTMGGTALRLYRYK